ncbi:MAG: hypothetical protein HYT62_05220 [Candidatus Yanofskybacteria bacterium]|nr:hypothetical protein [Candidatus Yanofskybacteria bacterium]
MRVLGKKGEFEKAIELQYKIAKLKRVFQNAQILNTKYLALDTKNSKNRTAILKQLANVVDMNHPPYRIECYDIANIQGKYAVGAMIVSENGQLNNKEYRLFKIKTVTGANDTAMLHEILTRRFNHPEWKYPDLIIVDGGKSQLNAAQKVIYGSSTSIIQVIALVKNEKHAGHKIITTKKEVLLSALPVNVKNLLLQIDSEAHRFAINYYRRMHRKNIK